MFVALVILLSVGAFVAVAYPIIFQGGQSRSARSSAQETLDELLAQRDAAFTAIRELTFDHEVGKVTDEDFVVFEAHLKGVAADALRGLDEWETGLDKDLEGLVDQRAPVGRTDTSQRGGGRTCAACGAPASMDDKFCASCGTELPSHHPGAPSTCPHCGRAIDTEDQFCAGCGQAVG